MKYKVKVEQNPILQHKSVDGTFLDCEINVNSPESSLNDFVKQIGIVTTEELAHLNENIGDIWGGIANGHDILNTMTKHPASAQETFNSMFSTTLTHGFDQGHIVGEDVRLHSSSRSHIASNIMDKLISLA